MLWLTRPPYFRWLLVAAALVLSAWLELRPESTVDHPFALEEIRPGTTVTESDVEWRRVPAELLDPVSLPLVASRLVQPGEPLPAMSDVAVVAVPDGWWALALPTPLQPRPGEEVRVVLGSDTNRVTPGTVPWIVPGIFVGTADEDSYGRPEALVAVPGESVEAVARAAAIGEVTVVVRDGR